MNLKNQIIKAERRVLKELGFCVHVKHPHKVCTVYINFVLGLSCDINALSWVLNTVVAVWFVPENRRKFSEASFS